MNAAKIKVEFEIDFDEEGIDHLKALAQLAQDRDLIDVKLSPSLEFDPDPDAVPPSPAPAKGKALPPAAAKGKPAAPAKGKAAAPPKTNSKAKPKEPEQADIMDFTGDNDDEEDDTGGLGLGDDEPDEEFDGTAGEAHAKAMSILRTMLNNGQKADLKIVQQIMKVAKFHDVPVEQGFEFLKEVQKVQAQIGKH